VLADINQMILAVSKTEKCGKVNDGSMFANMNILSHMFKSDLLQLDGAYLLMINQILENDTNNNFSRDNFICSIQKINNVDFELDETKYNKKFGGMRSTIEILFADIAWKFQYLHCSKKLRIAEESHYNIRFKLICFLWNLKQAEKVLSIPIYDHHSLWQRCNWDYSAEKSDKPVTKRVQTEINNMNDQVSQQLHFIASYMKNPHITNDDNWNEDDSLIDSSICSLDEEFDIDIIVQDKELELKPELEPELELEVQVEPEQTTPKPKKKRTPKRKNKRHGSAAKQIRGIHKERTEGKRRVKSRSFLSPNK
jgi:hypothetical protein